ncbi:MAG: metal ABC transporter permease [Nitrosopumilus sp.]|nr:metal ABC transporter permease [Nitrosopumilus sp.]CAI9831125.1 ATP-binding domain-containing protein (ZnuB) [Nitrosopumilaceae archaeon]MDA7941211.1 metal ABC transporter permease [Nitrosopumilus sp.]MDA7942390.1 metal ABC transporter permease [Nitrosopumilus sp.]MDA7944888.1 metal ABC transporter permease [Nitrosopumilus sp.]
MLEILEYGFMQRALLAGSATAALCAVMGLFMVLRRYSLFGDAVAHTSFGGIAVGMVAGIYPFWTAYAVSVASAILITRMREKFQISGDAAVAVLLSSGIAIGLTLISVSGWPPATVLAFLFGSILLVAPEEAALSVGLSAALLLCVVAIYKPLLYTTFNERQARAAGIRAGAINYAAVVMAGITVVTSVQLVGVLLVSALFVIPNVTAMMYGYGFARTAALSSSIAVSVTISGILLSYVLDIAPAGTIVLLSIGFLAATLGLRSLKVIPRRAGGAHQLPLLQRIARRR